ncbi:ornithine carbamoyltransferase [Mycoplasmoides pirum]|uniref:ornithine carbamoyltransferase n=1 Tax=Mycoplasmoides pirum TaxID=2122 RepID=UPI000485A176|nr:ornithine carbamoyltransferase [Mycoplasmoides pirum]
MPVNLKGRSLDSALNFTTQEIKYLVDLSISLKKSKYQGLHVNNRPLVGKNIVILFQKDSTRTMCSFQVAAADLGASCTYIGSAGSNFGKKESVEDTAKVLGRFYDGIEFRCFKQTDVDKFVKHSGVPVWNGLSDQEHPTQIIADLMTMKEQLGELEGKKIVFAGDIKNNMGISCLIAAAHYGMHIVLAGPASYAKEINPEIIAKAQKLFNVNGGSLSFEEDKIKAATNADVIYTDVWVSLGEDFALFPQRIKELKPFQVDMAMIKAANPNVIFLHCLPAFHDDQTEFSMKIKNEFGAEHKEVATGAMEVTDEVFQSKYNKCFDQAENRMHSIKAIILATLGY